MPTTELQQIKAKKKVEHKLRNITIYGLISFYGTRRAIRCAKCLYRSLPKLYSKPTINVYYDHQWVEAVKKLQAQHARKFRKLKYLKHPVIVLFNDEYIGDHRAIIHYVISEHRILPELPYPNLFPDFADLLPKTNKKAYVYLDVRVGGLDDYVIGKMVFELHADIVPQTCKFFKNLCKPFYDRVYGSNEKRSKFSYMGSTIHRICGRSFIQGGKIPGCEFRVRDENYGIKHVRRGVISICNEGGNNSTTEFCISLKENSWLDGKVVAFGQLIFGEPILTAIQEVPTYYQRPLKEIVIVGCGIVPSPEDKALLPFTSAIEREKERINEAVELLRQARVADLNKFQEHLKNYLLASEAEKRAEYVYLEEVHGKAQPEEFGEEPEEELSTQEGAEEADEEYVEYLEKGLKTYIVRRDFTLEKFMEKNRNKYSSALLDLMGNIVDTVVEENIDYAKMDDRTELLDDIPKVVVRDAVDPRDVPSEELKLDKFRAGMYSLPESLRATLVKTMDRLTPSQLKLIGLEAKDILVKAGLGEDTLSITSKEDVISGMVLAVFDQGLAKADGKFFQQVLDEFREDAVLLMKQKGPEAIEAMLFQGRTNTCVKRVVDVGLF